MYMLQLIDFKWAAVKATLSDVHDLQLYGLTGTRYYIM